MHFVVVYYATGRFVCRVKLHRKIIVEMYLFENK